MYSLLFKPFHLYFRRSFKPSDLFAKVADFDGVLYTIVQKDDSNILSVSISLSFYKEIEQFGDSKVCFLFY